jgi:hypothetical protein
VYVGKLLQRYPAGRRLWQLLLGEEEDQPVGQVVWSDVCSDEDEKVRGLILATLDAPTAASSS